MNNKLWLWNLTQRIVVKNEPEEPIINISNIDDHLYVQTANNSLYHGIVEIVDELASVELILFDQWKVLDIDSCSDFLYMVDLEGCVFKCDRNLERIQEICLVEDYKCMRGHSGNKFKMKVAKISVGEYGQMFITEFGCLWASGSMPQVGVNSDVPRKVTFFSGRTVYSVNVGSDFAIVTVSKQVNNEENDSEEDIVFTSKCPQCLSISQLTSPASQNSASETCLLGVKIQGSYDIETTSTSSKNDSSASLNDSKLNPPEEIEKDDDAKIEKNIIFRNTEAAKEFLTRQISRMSSAGEEYLECAEKPTRIIKENVASFVKTVGDKVVTLSRHVSGSSDCNSVLEISNGGENMAKEDCVCSVSQCTSERDVSEEGIKERSGNLVRIGSDLINCEVWTWGNIVHGQLGMGDKIKRERPMIITKLSNIGVRKVSVQNYHAAVLTLDGRTFIWGRNDRNQVTVDNDADQSSPKLYQTEKEERIKDVVCGEYCTALLTNKLSIIYFGNEAWSKTLRLYSDPGVETDSRIQLFCNLLCSAKYVLYNADTFYDGFFSTFLLEQQRFLEEMLAVVAVVIKPLQKKTVHFGTPELLDDLCRYFADFLYFLTANTQSLLEHSNRLISLCDIIMLKHLDEFIYVYKCYIGTLLNVISIDGFPSVAKLVEIPQSLYKLRPDLFASKKDKNDELVISTFLCAPIVQLDGYMKFIKNYTASESAAKFSDFVDEQTRQKQYAETTREFWLNSGKVLDFLRCHDRRLLRDSHQYPIHLSNAGRFSSHWFILFNDLFVHMNGSTSNLHNLTTIWLEPQQDESSQLYQISLKTPEDTLVLTTNEAEMKIEWFHALQNAIKEGLNKRDALQPPSIRSGSYQFAKSGIFKDAVYTGRWMNAKMHGSGQLKWNDGKVYTGQFVNNQMCGFGTMDIPNVGTYEGQWKENQQNGFGIFTYSNSDVYKGHFKDGLPHGHGFLRKGNFTATAASFYIGDWVNGMKNGYGVMDDIAMGEKYIGTWADNKKHGSGLIVTYDGIYYEGIFNQDTLTGQGVMILEDGVHYTGDFKGTGSICGKGTLTLPSGHTIEGSMTGSWSEGIKISNGTFTCKKSAALPANFTEYCTPANQKWKALFKYCHQVLGVPENPKNGLNTQKIWQNVAAYLSNNARRKNKNDNINSINQLDIIPPYGMEKLSLEAYLEVKNYLGKAFESSIHPLGTLLTDLSEAYTTTYGGNAHPLLLSHAIDELRYLCKRLYEIVRFLFPALPAYEKEACVENGDGNEEIVNYQSLLYPLLLPKVHHSLFTLFTLKNEVEEKQYKRTLLEWNKMSDATLMEFLSVDQKFVTNARNDHVFEDAIETLQQLKSTFSPTEKLLVIRQTVEKMTPVAVEMLGKDYVWNMDDLFPVFLFVVVRARIPELAAELDFVDNFMDPSLESGELGIMYTTLKACYQQILQEKSSTY